MMRHSYEPDGADFTSAVAIHSLEVSSSKSQIARSNTTKQEPQQGGLIRKASMKDATSSSTLKPATCFADVERHKQTSPTPRPSDSKSHAWEKAQIAKIRKRYEKLHSEIQAWENERKLGEKSRMERKKGDLQVRKSRNLKHYYYKIARISNVAHGARARVEEKRKHEESIVKDTARKMRSTRKAPVTCFCF